MANQTPLALSRATADDLPEIGRLQYLCFPAFIREIFMGCKTEDDLPRITRKHVSTLDKDPHDVWIKIVDTATGKIVAASNWKIYPNSTADSAGDEAPDWLDGDALERSRMILSAMNDARKRANPHGYVRKWAPLPGRCPLRPAC